MQLNFRAAAVGGSGYTTFADSINVTSPRTNPDQIDYRPPAFKMLEQVEPLAGGASQFVANRGNALWALQVQIEMWYATAIAAREAVATLAAALNVGGNLDIQIYETSSSDAVYLPACSLSEITPYQSGCYIKLNVKFTGPNFTTTAP